MTTRTYTDERRWANVDPAQHYNGAIHVKQPDWRRVFAYLVTRYDYDAAEMVRIRNLVSDECAADEHEACVIPETCTCAHHGVRQLALEHPRLGSLR